MNFKFFHNTQEAVKYSKKCDTKKIEDFREQSLYICKIILALEVIETYYKAGFEREKAESISNVQYVLSQINQFTFELIEEFDKNDKKSEDTYQPRYLAYCKYRNIDPEDEFSGLGFMDWIRENLEDYCKKFREVREFHDNWRNVWA